MSPDLAAQIAATEREIADRLDSFGVPDPQEAAHRLVRWMQGRGWRLHPALADKPPSVPPARSTVARARIAEAKAAVEAVRGNRPELAADVPVHLHPGEWRLTRADVAAASEKALGGNRPELAGGES